MFGPLNSFMALTMQSAQLGFDAQRVIGLRMMCLAAGGSRAQTEAQRMIVEKSAALLEAQMTVATALATGRGHNAAKTVLSGYRRKVRANHRRLMRG